MRCVILLPFLSSTLFGVAQSWSPSGATWTYGLQGDGVTGYSRYTYAGDTLLHDTAGQRIDLETVVMIDPDPTPIVDTHASAVITSYANDVVSVWDPLSERWDTLFWFGAGVNDHWKPPHYEGECGPAESITVAATGTQEEDGVTLRWFDLANDRGRIIERAGWFWNLEITPSCLIVEGLAGQRCYSDDEISYSPPTWTTDCLVIGVDELRTDAPLLAYPNPGTAQLTIRIPGRSATISMSDACGRAVRSAYITDGMAVIDATDLAPGPYALSLWQGGISVPAGTWLKY